MFALDAVQYHSDRDMNTKKIKFAIKTTRVGKRN